MTSDDSVRDAPRRPSRVTDPAFLAFLHARRQEEQRAAADRSPGASQVEARRTEQGLAVLDGLIEGIESGRDLDSMSLQLVKIGYGKHPDFRPEWHATHG